ncbi:MAG: cytidine deaminase [Candidatus Merdisoma sp.]|jgi:cytidine deaminase
MDDKTLMRTAIQAREYSYSPYSKFRVGAALLCADGSVYTGCNMENAAFTPGICAERTAIYKAVSEGKREFQAIAIVGGALGHKVNSAEGGREGALGQEALSVTAPCGVCRQVMREFCDPESFRIILGTGEEDLHIYLLKELLPLSFGPENLETTQAEEEDRNP